MPKFMSRPAAFVRTANFLAVTLYPGADFQATLQVS